MIRDVKKMAVETVLNTAMVPIAGIVLVIVAIIAWKVFKFAVKKISAVIQGIIAIALIAFALAGSPAELKIGFGLAGVGILFGAISNKFR